MAGLLAGALWGLVFIAPRMAPGLSPVDLAAGRFGVFGLMSLLVLACTPGPRRWPSWAQLRWALALSVLGFSGYYALLVLAIRDAGTEVPTLVIGTIPLWLMLLGKPERLRWAALVPGLLLTAAGLALMVHATPAQVGAAAASASRWPPHFLRGVGYAVVAMATWTAFGLLNAAWLRRNPGVTLADWSNWLGVATGSGALLLWLALGTPAQVLRAQPDFMTAVWVCVGTGLGAAWLATLLWNIASQRLSASLCGQLIVSETLFALLYSFVLDGHGPSASQGAACVLFTLGILFSIKAHR